MQKFLVTLLVTVNTTDTVSVAEIKEQFEDYEYESGVIEVDDVKEI